VRTPGYSGTRRFKVTNVGTNSGTFTFQSSCTGALSGCGTQSPGSLTLAVGAWQEVTVPYTASTAGGSGTMTLTATATDASALHDATTQSMTIDPPVWAVAVLEHDSTGTLRLRAGIT